MTLCASIVVEGGLVTVADGVTTFSTTCNSDEEPRVVRDTVKLVCAPRGQPWVLMSAGRGTYFDRPIFEEASSWMESTGLWNSAASLNAVADGIAHHFTSLDSRQPNGPFVDCETGTEFSTRFSGIVCGYSATGVREVWNLESTPQGPTLTLCQDKFVWIGAEGAAGEAQAALTDPGSQGKWYHDAVGARLDDNVHTMPLDQASNYVYRAMPAMCNNPQSLWSHWGVGGQWRCVAISPQGVSAVPVPQ